MSDTYLGPFARTRDAVHLEHAPLIRVLCQVQWPEQTLLTSGFGQLADQIAIGLAEQYPISIAPQGNTVNLEVDPVSGQVRQTPSPPIKQWSSVDDVWWVYFTPMFVTLENRGAYTNREELIARFSQILAVVGGVVPIPAAQRVGWRYVNRIDNAEDFGRLPELVEPAVLGARAIPLPEDVSLVHSFSDSLFRAEDINVIARWGCMPPGVVHDPSLPPVPSESWFLDIDAFREGRVSFDPQALIEQVHELSSTAYSFFRWAVKDSFVERFGGVR